MQRIATLWNKGLVGKLTIGLLGLVVVCCIIGVIFSPSRGQRTQNQPTAVAGAAVQPVADQPTAAPAATEGPIATTAPTKTPEPTDTPAPTATPTEVPIPTPLPEPVRLEGNGQTATDPFTPPSTINRVVASHQGRRNFALKSYTPDGKSNLLINTIGNYQGIVLLATDQETFFEVDADGAWSLQVEPVAADEAAAQGVTGSGDYVSGLFAPAKTGPMPYAFTHTGERNFAVYLHCAGGSDLVQNEIGASMGHPLPISGKGHACGRYRLMASGVSNRNKADQPTWALR